ncbi:MAG: hypothetical protein JSS86_25730 [Cyanobacteria bacterium SZAS LIN-2]|nr:hypothetical protein [Cyanobacteria bacterium SZAS LIN-2]
MNLEIFDSYIHNQICHKGPSHIDTLMRGIRELMTQAASTLQQAEEALQTVQEHDQAASVAIAENGGRTSPVLERKRLSLKANYAACVRAFRYQGNLLTQVLLGDLKACLPQLIDFSRTANSRELKGNAIVCARVVDLVPQSLAELKATLSVGGEEVLKAGEDQLNFLAGALAGNDDATMASFGLPLRIPTPVLLTPNSRFDLLRNTCEVLFAATEEGDRLNRQCTAFDMAALERENMWGTFVASKPRAEVQSLIDKSHDSLVLLEGSKTATIAAAGQLMQTISACVDRLIEAMAADISRKDFALPLWHAQAVELHLLAGKSAIARAFHVHRRMMRANAKPLHWPDLPQRTAVAIDEAFEQVALTYGKD